MKGLDTLAQIVEHGTLAEAALAVGTVFPDLVDTEAKRSPIDDITFASQLVSMFSLSWGRRVDAVVAVYDTHHTGQRIVYHPLSEIAVTEGMPEPRALTLAALRSIPVSRSYLMSRVEQLR